VATPNLVRAEAASKDRYGSEDFNGDSGDSTAFGWRLRSG